MAFFEGIKIQNFRCLHDVEFELAPFTVFVGANGSGKSSILSALIPEIARHKVNTTHGAAQPPIVKFTSPTRTVTVRRGVPKTTEPAVIMLQLTLERLREENRASRATSLASDGRNLANVLSTLGRRKQQELAEQFCDVVPIYSDVDVRPVVEGHVQVVFQDRWHEDRWYAPQEVSDGTLIMLALLVACHMPQPPDILCIDEMERGLHPYLLERVVDLCRMLSSGKLGKPVQVVGATHSPTLLDFLEPGEVRFVSRDRDTGGSVVTAPPTGTDEWKRAFEAYRDSLGDIWLSGALGGVVGR